MTQHFEAGEPWGMRPGTFQALRQIDELHDQIAPLFQCAKYEEALSLARKAMDLAQTYLNPEHPKSGLCCNNLGVLLMSVGESDDAFVYFERCIASYEAHDGPRNPELIDPLNNSGLLLQQGGDLEQANIRHERALLLSEEILGPERLETAQSLNDLGLLRQRQGRLPEARRLWKRALKIREKNLGVDHPDTFVTVSNLGALEHQTGNSAKGIMNLERVVNFCERHFGPDHPHTAGALSNLGMMFLEVGDYDSARRDLERAYHVRKSTLGRRHVLTAQSVNNLGILYLHAGPPRESVPYFHEAYEILAEELGAAHPDTSKPLNNLAAVLRELADPAARNVCEAALAIRLEALGPNHPETARSANNLAVVLDDLGEKEKALAGYRDVLDIREKVLGVDHPEVVQSCHNLGGLLFALGQAEEAMAYFRRAAVIEEKLLGHVFGALSERQRMAYLETQRNQRDGYLSFVWQSPQLPDAIPWLVDVVLRRKGLAAEALAVQRDALFAGKYPEARTRLHALANLRARYAQKALGGAEPDRVDRHREELESLGHERDLLEAELARLIPEMNLTRQIESVDHRSVAEALPANSVLVEFVRFDVFDFNARRSRGEPRWQPARYLAFVIPADEPHNVQMIDLGEAANIDQLVAEFRMVVSVAPNSHSFVDNGVGPRLRAAVFEPLISAVGDRKRLLLAPDGDLSLLPFEALTGSDGRLLIQDYRISYLSCGRDVLRFGVKSSNALTASVVVADPAFNLTASSTPKTEIETAPVTNADVTSSELEASRSPHLNREMRFGPLKRTREEGMQIAALLRVQPWLRTDALEGRLKKATSPRVLHLATHGFFLPTQGRDLNKLIGGTFADVTESSGGRLSGPGMENPLLRSGLALAGANVWLRGGQVPSEAEDGLLTAEDVTGMDLLDTELVVLSACETGLGEVRTGEGVFGLRRAFMLAGAKRLVMSLWKVPDHHTQELMVDFYHRVLCGQSGPDALREAQLAMKKKYSSPYFWAAFIFLGNPAHFHCETSTPSTQNSLAG